KVGAPVCTFSRQVCFYKSQPLCRKWPVMKRPKLAGVFLLLAVLLAYLMFVKNHYSRPDRFPPPHRPAESRTAAAGRSFRYGVMFDAGSTGTRVHIFRFQMETPRLDHETFRAIKPGLSAYADDPHKCSDGILQLLQVAMSSVPPSSWTSTPLVLKATAGLRLLPGEKAQHLLDTVRHLTCLSHSSPVCLCGLHGDGSTVGMLDLGGGSTQITFSPQDEKTIQTSPIDYIRSFQMFNNTHTVYTHSYLGLGLMSARLAVLGGVDAPPRT
uniref:Ectonucleoside triphosphate diphosphohydrolase 6 n=1 Tax=Acanthochromis polyacanthus TaxID=80966 RepID=A0A3Q1FHV6_9TELE